MPQRIGPYTVSTLIAGRFRLDGGAMFGNVPKTLWQREQPADELNRIHLAARCLFLQGEGRVILVDTGCGEKMSGKEAEIYAIDNAHDSLAAGLAARGIAPDQVTDVVLTHLHFDHAGGGTSVGPQGSLVPTFANATYHVQRENLETALAPSLREVASYLPANVEPLLQAGQLRTVEGEVEIVPGLFAFLSHGHTRGLQGVEVRGDAEQPSLFFPADLMPTDSHLRLPYTMGYDLHAAWIIEEKARLLNRVRPERDLIVFEHAPHLGAGTIRMGKKYHEIAERVDL